jgi:hypothetical protein
MVLFSSDGFPFSTTFAYVFPSYANVLLIRGKDHLCGRGKDLELEEGEILLEADNMVRKIGGDGLARDLAAAGEEHACQMPAHPQRLLLGAFRDRLGKGGMNEEYRISGKQDDGQNRGTDVDSCGGGAPEVASDGFLHP